MDAPSQPPTSAAAPSAAPPPAPARPPRRWPALSARVGIVVVAAAVAALFVARWDSWVGSLIDQTTDDAYVTGDITPLSAQVEGNVSTVAVGDYQRVKAGDLLVQIDDNDYRARVAQAEADVAGAEAAIENLKSHKAQQHDTIAEAEGAIQATAADVERTKLEAQRQRALVATTFGTQQRLEQAVADQKRFEATLSRSHAALEAQRREMAVLDTQESVLRAQLKAKRAMLELANIMLGYTRIAAPVDGMVGERQVRPGQYVRPGTEVISVVPLDTVWVVANYKETQLTRVRIGQPASITIDSFPGVTVTGHVDSVAPASGSQFSLLPPDNATGNFTKVVQRIPVKIVLDPGHPLMGVLRPGMSVIATIHTDSTPTAP
ncbi:MAG TPA: HlyD family secretion protein [Candidatus Sulfotelmatobacter sp.]|nr:HlyD family secretion protein [Candidatus Sulfotelmatobacter sp.]